MSRGAWKWNGRRGRCLKTVVLFTVRVHLLRVYDEERSRAIASSPPVAVKATVVIIVLKQVEVVA